MATYKTQVLLHAIEERLDEWSEARPLRPGERLFREMVQVGARELGGGDGEDPEAFLTALTVVLAICRYQSGDRFRVPGLSTLDAWARDLEIAKLHNGRNSIEIARRFNISTDTVDAAVRKHREVKRRALRR